MSYSKVQQKLCMMLSPLLRGAGQVAVPGAHLQL